ncbi:MAG: alanine racemase [Legionellales bacterium]|jgi:alanine racemase
MKKLPDSTKTYSHATWIEIDLARFQANLQIIRKAIGPKVKLCFPVKANAYGHGIAKMSLAAQHLVDYFGVSCLQEGMQLRALGIKTPIIMLGAVDVDQMSDAIAHDIILTIASLYKAQKASEAATALNKIARVHLEIETGMQRTGMRIETAQQVVQHVVADPMLSLEGIYSHFATADKPNDPNTLAQIKTFAEFIQPLKAQYPHLICHLANSDGVIYYPQSYFDMVRPGILALGYTAAAKQIQKFSEIEPFFSLHSRISFFKVVAENSGISYGHAYNTKKQTRIVTIPVGYGDGYRRALSNKGSVLIRGKRYPIAGMVCMDQFMVDIGQDEAYVGDEVILVGKSGNETISINDLAELCDTIAYEILCLFNNRIVRKYT